MTAKLFWRRARLASGLVLLLFVAGHLCNLALGLNSVQAMDRWRRVLLWPWQGLPGQGILLAATVVHTVLGLTSLAARRSLAMSRTDWVQVLLGVATPPLLLNHVVSLQVTSDLSQAFEADYGFVLAVYWSYAPKLALQQLLVVVIVWAHGAIGLYSALVIRPSWPRLAPIVLPMLFAVPILALLGFAQAGQEVLARLGADQQWQAKIEASIGLLQQVRGRLDTIEAVVFLAYGVAVATAVAVLASRILRRRSARVTVRYDGGPTAIGRPGLSVLDVSRANGIPHASVCSGRGRCGTCMITAGANAGLDAPGETETETLRRVRAPAGARLACQAHLLGPPLDVERIYPAFADAEAARLPGSWAVAPETGMESMP